MSLQYGSGCVCAREIAKYFDPVLLGFLMIKTGRSNYALALAHTQDLFSLFFFMVFSRRAPILGR
jgi:hypothetical protein